MPRSEQEFAAEVAAYAARSPWHARNAARFEASLREVDAEPSVSPEEIERAERAVATATRNLAAAGRERAAGRISKGCHRDAVAVLRDAERRLAALRAGER